MIGDAVYSMLSQSPAVRAIVSTRIYADAAPENVTFPYVTYEQGGEQRGNHINGVSDAATGIVTVWCWATSRLGARQLADAITVALNMQAGSFSDTIVEGVFLQNAADRYEQPEEGGQRGVFGCELAFKLNWRVP